MALPIDMCTISDTNKFNLIKPVSKIKVYHTLFFSSFGQEPMPDGFNADFYRLFWRDIGDHLFKAVDYFFKIFSLPRSWNQIYVALILKIDRPQRVSDY